MSKYDALKKSALMLNKVGLVLLGNLVNRFVDYLQNKLKGVDLLKSIKGINKQQIIDQINDLAVEHFTDVDNAINYAIISLSDHNDTISEAILNLLPYYSDTENDDSGNGNGGSEPVDSKIFYTEPFDVVTL